MGIAVRGLDSSGRPQAVAEEDDGKPSGAMWSRRRTVKQITIGIVAVLLVALVACDQVHGVSSSRATNLEGAPGTANDLATGGGGNRMGPGNDGL
jgi:hypothetical protein